MRVMRPKEIEYDIKDVERRESAGESIRAISKSLGFHPTTLGKDLAQNYARIVRYKKKR